LAASIDRVDGGMTPSRIPRSDNDVAEFIRTNLAKFPSTSKTRLLQEFRDKGRACEQKRFGAIYAMVRNEPSVGMNA
jgi:hypothetical protein